MSTYWRIQPRGLSMLHYSTTSSGDPAGGLFVLEEPWQTLFMDVGTTLRMARRAYGDEVLEIEAPRSWASSDVEGVLVDPSEAEVVRRYSWAEWLSTIMARPVSRATERAYDEARQTITSRLRQLGLSG